MVLCSGSPSKISSVFTALLASTSTAAGMPQDDVMPEDVPVPTTSTAAVVADFFVSETVPPPGRPAAAMPKDFCVVDVMPENMLPRGKTASAYNKKQIKIKCSQCAIRVRQSMWKNHICGTEQFKWNVLHGKFMGVGKKALKFHRKSHMKEQQHRNTD